ncbi:hypothetical protein QTP86_028415 [Hemibagrus guttatus]|nr:hypothetical protein QTP86_028415 [Hemibagrus guttatus]
MGFDMRGDVKHVNSHVSYRFTLLHNVYTNEFECVEHMMLGLQLCDFICLTLLNLIIVMCCKACNTAEYEIDGECCPMCAPGQHVLKHCDSQLGTQCKVCTGSTYTDVPNGLTACLPCAVCDEDNGLHVKHKCSYTSDALCEPLMGYYCIETQGESCRKAQEHSVCLPGEYIYQNGTASMDTVCKDCTEETYSDGSFMHCKPHTNFCPQTEEHNIDPGLLVQQYRNTGHDKLCHIGAEFPEEDWLHWDITLVYEKTECSTLKMVFTLEHTFIFAVIFLLNIKLCFCACARAEYEINKECCPMCAPGNHVYRHCTEFVSTTCVPCVDSFTSEPNGLLKCLSCAVCDPGQGLRVKTACARISDTVCEPLEGSYCTNYEKGSCTQAVEHTKCRPGQYIKQKAEVISLQEHHIKMLNVLDVKMVPTLMAHLKFANIIQNRNAEKDQDKEIQAL